MQQTFTPGRVVRALAPLAWIGPAVVLIAVVVVWPVVVMVQSSFLKISRFGVVQGSNGLDNYTKLFAEPDFGGVMTRSLVWVVAVVVLTVALSLGLAQLFNQRFPGRRFARWALIAPWAASVLMTAIIFKWMLDPEVGLINMIRRNLGLLDALGGADADPLGNAATAMPWLVFVAVFVSLPFTTYALLAGLSAIPSDVYEAAKMDGASRFRTYWSITLPLLRPALVVATLINVMNVFNSFPIIWAMTHGQPGYSTATSTIFMYILKGSDIGESAAMSVVNFGMVIVLTIIFLKVSKWRTEVS
ncbi:sugar ABC transporter permease [Planomonospora sp. ID91781]|uniref:ABC transporter permease n=3 Tax=Planomonospora TaxID=1998 RepID=A0A171CTY2_9ACTN|nr:MULTISPECIES: sugar ABC transporter permease [Planomonospora]MBG0823513.1 sugar ABC transporter permease [Planomonospora sp. ID91781]GAT67212.1 ABC transporter permease [Planomonospora sphaerica]GGK89868.1 ABC transporter permease [Planomonospora parontospora]GII11706.1 ABC transporter permease [Planomonospora parontospora subsp. parontospora]